MKKRKILALALASALCLPQTALAAQDDSGMQYTSASEGFYGSLRAVFRDQNKGKKNDGAYIGTDRGSNRLGVRGSLDLGGGLSGLYRTEWGFSGDAGSNAFGARLGYVGLSGGFGAASFGRQWSEEYNFVTSSTDLTNNSTGVFAPTFRLGNLAKYVSPDINGFQGAIQFRMDGATEKDGSTDRVALTHTTGSAATNTPAAGTTDLIFTRDGTAITTNVAAVVTAHGTNNSVSLRASKGSEQVDEWALAAKYSIRGFNVAGVYSVKPDQLVNRVNSSVDAGGVISLSGGPAEEDATFWAVRLGYGQDNWSVNAWYGEQNTSDTASAYATIADDEATAENQRAATTFAARGAKPQDTEIFSVAGNVDVGKVSIYAIHDNRENEWGLKDNNTVVGVTYHLGSRSRVWVDYAARDYDSDKNTEDFVAIGLRHDF